MSLLKTLIEERKDEWLKKLAQHREDFIAKEAYRSSGFQLELADLFIDELALRCELYIRNDGSLGNFDEFFRTEKESLLSDLESPFKKSIPIGKKCDLLQKKYKETMLSNLPLKPKPPIGF